MRLLLATSNKGKLLELQRILGNGKFEVVSLDRFEPAQPVEETGSTYSDNALIKARHWNAVTGLATVADDSGLEVEALNGGPGLRSARFAGPFASDSDRIWHLLNQLERANIATRAARYVCAAAIVWNGGERVFLGEALGEVLAEPKGDDGFGYDPIFFYPPLNRTFAEIEPELKDRVSHRGIAFRSLSEWLSKV